MKNYKSSILILALIMAISSVSAQTINWKSLENNKHILNANVGAEYGTIYGVGYGYQIKNKYFPVVTNVEFSIPSGNKIFDDFKTKIGGQIRWVEYRNFQFSTKIQGVFRSYKNDFVSMANFGSDLSGIVGYYKTKWFASAEVGFDKAIVTHFKHTAAYKEQFPGVVDGWYQPSTGGNFYCGLQAGYSFRKNDIYIRAGKILEQDFETSPMFPFYAQLGYNIKF